jgi:uncharacterized membrane-anchored protein YhcB (DUF1043 family)
MIGRVIALGAQPADRLVGGRRVRRGGVDHDSDLRGVLKLAVGERSQAFSGVSPGMLPPMGLVFGLLVGFLVAQLWSDASQARDAVNREASSLRSVVLLASAFPGAPEQRLDALVRRQIQVAVNQEWPAMEHQHATLTVVPSALAGALHDAIGLAPKSFGQQTAQREIVTSLEDALDARRQQIILSQSDVNWVKWTAVVALALLTLLAIAFVHSGNRRTAAIAMAVFATAVAVTLIVIAAQDRPFSGHFRVKPDVLLQVVPRGS